MLFPAIVYLLWLQKDDLHIGCLLFLRQTCKRRELRLHPEIFLICGIQAPPYGNICAITKYDMWRQVSVRWLEQILPPPILEGDEEKTSATLMLYYPLWVGIILVVLFILAVFLISPADWRMALVAFIAGAGLAVSLWQLRQKWQRGPALTIIWMLTLLSIVLGLSFGYDYPVILPLDVLVVLLSGLLLGRRSMILFTGLSLSSSVAVLILQHFIISDYEPYPVDFRVRYLAQAATWLYIVIFLYVVIRHRERMYASLKVHNYTHQQLISQLQATTISRAYLDNIVNSMAEMLVVVDADAFITMVNRATIERLGYSETELLGQPIEKLFADLPAEHSGVDTLRMQGSSRHIDKTLVTKAGQRIPILFSGQVMFNAQRHIEGIVCVMQDVSEIRETQEALSLSNERLNLAIQASHIVIFDWNIITDRIVVDGGVLDLVGRTPEEIEGPFNNWLQLVVPEDIPASTEALDRHLKGETALLEMELRLRHQAGHIVWVLVRGRALRNREGIPTRVLVTVIDITERKKLEEALRKTITRLHTVLDAIPDMIVRTQRDGTYLEVLPGSEIRPALPLHEYPGRKLQEFLPLDTVNRLIKATEEALRTNKTQVLEHQWSGDEATLHDYEVRIVAYGDDEALQIVRDITVRKQAEQRLLQLAIEREQKRVLTQFIRDASHEFRTPLTIIKTNLFLLEHHVDPDQRKNVIQRIDDQTDSLEGLIEGLLIMSQLDGEVTLELERLNLNRITSEVLDTKQAVLGHRLLKIELNLDPELARVQGDSHFFHRALNELLDNAIRYTPDNGTITIRSFNREASSKEVVIEIKDTGKGISPKVLPHIFKRFYREDRSHTTKGFGLGLSIAQQVMGLHAGKIEVESAIGEGSTFRICLPAL